MANNFQEKITFIWDLADLLRGPYKRNEYQKVILPFTVLKRFDCVLSDSKANVLETHNQFKGQFENMEHVLQEASKDKKGVPLGFYNYSKYDFKTLLEDPEHIEQNLIHYIDSFSKNVQDIFEKFKLKAQIEKLSKTDRLFRLVKKFFESKVDLHPDIVSNHEMGTIFEELTRKFAEQSNEEAGDHFTPKDVVELMTKLMFIENGVHLTKKNLIKTVYDPACGTGGMLSSCKDFITKMNETVDIVLFGQEINDEIFAICKSDMLIRGEDANNVQGGDDLSTLSKDQFPNEKFDYIISNPPYGTKWEADQDEVEKEAKKGFEGRFGAGTPRINDGQLLFLQHMISKMKLKEKSRIAVITNGSPLFTGDAGSGESDIRKWIIEGDLIEAIIALPSQMFYKTGIGTYIWILTNEKPVERVGKIQLIDATSKFKKMRKSLGSKRQYISPEDIKDILEYYDNFKPSKNIKIFDNEEFGYTKVVVERPIQLNYCVNEERLENIYSYSAFSKLSESKSKNPDDKLKEEEEGKAKQEEILKALKSIGDKLYKNWDEFEELVKKSLKNIKLTPVFIKNIILKLSEHDETAEYVLDAKGKKQPDSNLRDSEKIPLKEDIQAYFDREVKPYYSDAWIDKTKDKIGYELNFTQYFYKYVPPRALEDIEADIKKVKDQINEFIKKEQIKSSKYNEYKEVNNIWLNMIPKKWDVIKGKYKFKVKGGYAFSSDDFIDEGVPLFRIGDMQEGTIDFNDCKKLPDELTISKKEFLVKEKDVLIAMTGATIGKISQVPSFEGKALLNQRVGKIDIKNNKDFYRHVLESDFIQEQVKLIAEGSAQENISGEQIESFVIPNLSKEQEKNISEYLNEKDKEIDSIIEKNKQLILLMQEYKKSLKYNVLTGRIKVEEEENGN